MKQEKLNISSNSLANIFWPVPRGKLLEFLEKQFSQKAIIGEQTHSNKVAIVHSNSPHIIEIVDGLVTKEKNIILAVAVADCQIIFASDPTSNVIGIAHAGAKGIYGEIGKELVKKMVKLGAKAKDINILISPSIGECYEVDKFGDTNNYKKFLLKFGNKVAKKKPTGKFLNLRQAQIQTLTKAGVLEDNIKVDLRCTLHARDNIPSHRREGENRKGNLVGIIYFGDH